MLKTVHNWYFLSLKTAFIPFVYPMTCGHVPGIGNISSSTVYFVYIQFMVLRVDMLIAFKNMKPLIIILYRTCKTESMFVGMFEMSVSMSLSPGVSQSYFTTDDQSVSKSLFQGP
jgi:hypothetical protein